MKGEVNSSPQKHVLWIHPIGKIISSKQAKNFYDFSLNVKILQQHGIFSYLSLNQVKIMHIVVGNFLIIQSIAIQFSSISSVHLLSCVWLFETPWIAACQASLSITNSRSSLKFMSIELVMPSSHLILCRPLLLLPPAIRINPSQHQNLFQWENSSYEVAKVLEFQL